MRIAAMTKPTSERWHELFLFVVMFIVVIGLKLPVLQTPYFWDEMGAYVEPSHWLSNQSLVHALPGLHPPDMFFGHPPALYALVALIFKLFGTASSGPHLLSMGFAFLGLCFTYRIGRLLYGRQVGIAAAALLFAMPLYFAQAGMMLGDIPVAALGVMTVYYSLTRCYPAFLLAGFCLVLVKETGMAVVVAAVIYQLLTNWRGKVELRRALMLAVPLVPLALFFAVQKLATGSLLPNPYFSVNAFATFAPMSLLLKGGEAIYNIFIVQFRFVLTLAAIAGLVLCRQVVFRPQSRGSGLEI
jgi:4-amino-4-deoxy-L-arabinose transferase-like glycosyltransferase